MDSWIGWMIILAVRMILFWALWNYIPVGLFHGLAFNGEVQLYRGF